MSNLRVETLTLPAADLGPLNPLPVLTAARAADAPVKTHENVPESAREYLGYGCDTGVLPYRLQDQYSRTRTPRDFKVAVLENEILRATFLLDFGGRLHSLIHKTTGRNLLYTNPVFQPANLA